ncbi:MAG: hypothetical protein MUC96_25305 [Myxococcaceae bacterium]|nr:hypothetical protein [Myxococcaceae bacterium]
MTAGREVGGLALLFAFVFPFAVGAVRQSVPGWWSPSQQNLVIERHASGARCIASEGGSLCSPLWMAPRLVLDWCGDRVRGALR